MNVSISFYYAYHTTRIRTTLRGSNIKNIQRETGQNSRAEMYQTILFYDKKDPESFKRKLSFALDNIRQSPNLKSCLLEGGSNFSSFYLDNSIHVKLTKENRSFLVKKIEKLLRHRAMYPKFYAV